jgi:hypothetical protein
VPRILPDQPQFTTSSERQVWTLLRDQMGPDALLMANVRISDAAGDHEIDLVAVFPGWGLVAVEVKGGSVWHDGARWLQAWSEQGQRPIDPVGQALRGRYAMRDYVEADQRWTSQGRPRFRWSHAIVLPATEVRQDFDLPDCPRHMVVDRSQLKTVASVLRETAELQGRGYRPPDSQDVDLLAEIMRGRGLPQRDVVALALDRETRGDLLTSEQANVLGATRLLRRVEVRGGAGSGKTWLAVEQARRLARDGERVALTCYSRGLAEYLRRVTQEFPRKERPAYVGEFHRLGLRWGAAAGSDDDSDYWERRLPEEMVGLAAELPPGQRFDSVVVDEAQDFAEAWWPALMAALQDEEGGGCYVFSDEGQQVFSRYGRPPLSLVPLVLDHNLRNTKQIAEAFNPLASLRMRLLGGEGPAVRFVACAPEEALGVADDAVDALLEQGWRPEDVALLTTGARHPEQAARQESGQDAYWQSFWDTEQVFYGHVLGFKGMERRAVVLALNEKRPRERARERLYVGMSRARDQLVVVGDEAYVEHVAGPSVLRRLREG